MTVEAPKDINQLSEPVIEVADNVEEESLPPLPPELARRHDDFVRQYTDPARRLGAHQLARQALDRKMRRGGW
ncbi:MAG TPA: hypothetical protein VFH39_03630 [Candidatus Saccharimonadales bacterium]|nr:hypothetical protein [Candidatus Saccharimonadales bacterium]